MRGMEVKQYSRQFIPSAFAKGTHSRNCFMQHAAEEGLGP